MVESASVLDLFAVVGTQSISESKSSDTEALVFILANDHFGAEAMGPELDPYMAH